MKGACYKGRSRPTESKHIRDPVGPDTDAKTHINLLMRGTNSNSVLSRPYGGWEIGLATLGRCLFAHSLSLYREEPGQRTQDHHRSN